MSEIGVMLAQWLNHSKDNPAHEQVCNLLTALRGLEPLLKQHRIVRKKENGTTEYIANSPGAILRDAINKQLAVYQFRPALNADDAHTFRVVWMPNGSSFGEAEMVQALCELHNEGTLSRLRACLCGHWFMARSDNQECCSTQCRQKKWAKTGKGKEAGKQASKAFYDRERLQALKDALKSWKALPARERQRNDWMKWVSKTAKVRKAFIAYALEKQSIKPPIRILRT